ncbi:MAG: Na+/H+ antiporter NhaA [Bacteroidetes bacterium]|nr:Na+/H+ antiporter NhaA [Bacteroidota bacterium]
MRLFFNRLFSPIRYFINDSRAVGVILIVSTVISVILANSSWGNTYLHFWHNEFHFAESLHLPANLLEWINNFGMGIFFLMAGTEIKRELVEGELSSFKKAVLPFGAAVGGMLVPALIFTSLNVQTAHLSGWGIPTATDIAFSLGVASLLGKRVPLNLKILLMALAIIDDLGAIVVIALFYGGHIQWIYLGAAALIFGALLGCTYFKIKFGIINIILALCLWFVILQSGIEASIAGVLFAFTVPVHKLVSVEKAIHNFVNFFILPLFAIANTALFLPGNFGDALGSTVSMGIMAGLVIGKPLGIFIACYILVSTGFAQLPTNIKWKQVLGMGTLAGIGFTMSIFTTMLAYTDESVRDIAKVAILLSVSLSAILSMGYFNFIGFESIKNTKELKRHQPDLHLHPA